jgi:hypothetical protein
MKNPQEIDQIRFSRWKSSCLFVHRWTTFSYRLSLIVFFKCSFLCFRFAQIIGSWKILKCCWSPFWIGTLICFLEEFHIRFLLLLDSRNFSSSQFLLTVFRGNISMMTVPCHRTLLAKFPVGDSLVFLILFSYFFSLCPLSWTPSLALRRFSISLYLD